MLSRVRSVMASVLVAAAVVVGLSSAMLLQQVLMSVVNLVYVKMLVAGLPALTVLVVGAMVLLVATVHLLRTRR